ncbi:type I methionyl aminopeptidase [Candidatus Schneideria nysicola]|uniref:type I methionyl aminopeptidase n=1 Tax=Candidatus Schneideria nysicola TaxID=1081631 RepID=UPI001CAA4323|nr:type I methionyl aminopeptidase [Candidatus Schneideria nysicola]UAJ64803.1 type I methionyl aminopeptidase [Candidatus Schneideria nysicola]
MAIYIKTSDEIKKMRIVGKLAAEVLEFIEPYIKIGISTGELDSICHKYITQVQQSKPASLGYQGFPKSICTSVNDVVCHGIPNINQKLKEGDIINIDITLFKEGFYSDTSKMFFVGNPTNIVKKLCDITQNSLYLAIQKIKPGIRLNILGQTIQNAIEKEQFSIVREYCGHGIGKNIHEEPQILHYKADDQGIILIPGMTFTIEPMINIGSCKTKIMQDGWTVKTKDHSLSAQYEHTLLVTESGCEILTHRQEETIPFIINHT